MNESEIIGVDSKKDSPGLQARATGNDFIGDGMVSGK
jgi:hypothetical protein